MPEGHSVFIHARDHHKLLAGKKVSVSSPQGRFDGSAVDGKRLRRVYPRGKHLFYDFGRDATVHVHLGRLGRFRQIELPRGKEPPAPTPATRMRLQTATHVIDLSGPTACHVVTDAEVNAILDRLGPDLLDPKAKAADVWKSIQHRATPIGALLMDQALMCGIGNIFRAEALHQCRIHPRTPTRELSAKQFAKLWKETVRLMKVGVKVGKIVTVPLRSLKKPVEKLTRDERFNVYRRKTCGVCGGPVKSITLGGRACYFCVREQKE
ncbi:MAG: DNA-formamidopyrimidine glycosylase family protein [Tepidisphaeraceae bacterium]